jgi:signal transduction histidine kinase/CheY-like chemotaxis protein
LLARGPVSAQRIGVIGGLALVYFVAGKVGLHFAVVHPSATAVWPATGLSFAALLLLGYRVWPGIFLGAFLVNVTTAGSFASSLGVATGNTLEALLGVYLVCRFANGRRVFDRVPDIFKFLALAGLASTMVSATFGATSLALCGYARWQDYWPIWSTWWLGDASGDLIAAPLLIVWSQRGRSTLAPHQVPEALLLFASAVGLGVLVFGGFLPSRLGSYEFLSIPPLIWAAFRFGHRGATVATAGLSAIAVWGTFNGLGPFAPGGARGASLFILQLFTMTAAMVTLPVAALVWEHKRAEAAARALGQRERAMREAAEAASRAKDEFLAMLGHELRNPLGAISIAAQILEHPATDAGHAANARGVIGRQVAHLSKMVNDLLDVARITSGKIALRLQPVNLARCAADCLSALTQGDTPLAVDLRVDSEPVWVNADADRLAQILTNLVSNAFKYTPPGGCIVVSATAEGDQAMLRVQDSGVGISADLLPRIFDLFAQGERGLERSRGGLGIGLTVVQQLVHLHGGTVEAVSEGRNRGSIFTIRLPRIAAPLVTSDAIEAANASASGRILIIEDNADARESLRTLLEMSGHEVIERADGHSGLEAAATLRPEIALIDIGLPTIDGYEVARRIRSLPGGDAIVLVALTGYGQPEDRSKALAAGFDTHFVKPLDLARLNEFVRSAAARRRSAPAELEAKKTA